MDLTLVGLKLPNVPNLSLLSLERAAQEAGFSVRTVPFSGFTDLLTAREQVMRLDPRICGVSVQTTDGALAAMAFTRLLRDGGFSGRIVCGGHFSTLNVDELLAPKTGVDTVVRFAGEKALVGMLRDDSDASLRTLPGVVFRDGSGELSRGAPAELVDLARVSRLQRGRELPDHLGVPAADVLASRGCEHHCPYCCVAGALDQVRTEARAAGRDLASYAPAKASPEQLAEQLAALYAERGARVFKLMDDNLLPDGARAVQRWAEMVRAGLDAAGVPEIVLSMQFRCDAIDEGSADALRALGLGRAYVGVDAFSDGQLRTLGRATGEAMGPRALRLLAERGVYPVCNALIVGPTVPFDSLVQEVSAMRRLERAPVHLLPLDVRAGTTLHQRVVARRLLEGGPLRPHYLFADARTERVARIVTSLPTRLAERSVPIALYDLGYNLAVAERLHPEAEVRALRAAYFDIAERWNRDQVRLLERALGAADDEDAVRALLEEERPRVDAHDRALLAEADEALLEVERACSRARREVVRVHARSRMLAWVAASMGMVGCSSAGSPMDAGPDAAAEGGVDAGVEASVDSGALDAGSCGDAAMARLDVNADVAGCFSACDGTTIQVELDAEGRATNFAVTDPGVGDVAPIVRCIRDLLADYCYPSLANSVQSVTAPHCWLA